MCNDGMVLRLIRRLRSFKTLGIVGNQGWKRPELFEELSDFANHMLGIAYWQHFRSNYKIATHRYVIPVSRYSTVRVNTCGDAGNNLPDSLTCKANKQNMIIALLLLIIQRKPYSNRMNS